MNDCGHDVRDTDCPVCCAILASDPYDDGFDPCPWRIPQCRTVDVLADPAFDAFHGLDVPFTDGSNH